MEATQGGLAAAAGQAQAATGYGESAAGGLLPTSAGMGAGGATAGIPREDGEGGVGGGGSGGPPQPSGGPAQTPQMQQMQTMQIAEQLQQLQQLQAMIPPVLDPAWGSNPAIQQMQEQLQTQMQANVAQQLQLTQLQVQQMQAGGMPLMPPQLPAMGGYGMGGMMGDMGMGGYGQGQMGQMPPHNSGHMHDARQPGSGLGMQMPGGKRGGHGNVEVAVEAGRRGGKVFVGGLPDCTEADLREQFEPYGHIVDAVVMTDHCGRTRGFGFVTWGDPQDCHNALQEQHTIKGKRVELKPADGRGKHQNNPGPRGSRLNPGPVRGNDIAAAANRYHPYQSSHPGGSGQPLSAQEQQRMAQMAACPPTPQLTAEGAAHLQGGYAYGQGDQSQRPLPI